MTGEFLVYVAVGRLLIWVGQTFFAETFKVKSRVLHKLVSCDLCLGVWVYTVLAYFFKITILKDLFFYTPLLSELYTGVAVSFAMHLIVMGWREKFDTVVI